MSTTIETKSTNELFDGAVPNTDTALLYFMNSRDEIIIGALHINSAPYHEA
jgi:hypothetical protein